MINGYESDWKNVRYMNNGWKLTTPTLKYTLVNIGAKVAGAGIMYAIGHVAGDLIEYFPAVDYQISRFVDFVSGIDVRNNMDGLFGLLGGISGFGSSGVDTFKDDISRLEKIAVAPLTLKMR